MTSTNHISQTLAQALAAMETPKGIANAIEPALTAIRKNLQHFPESIRAEVHTKLRDADAGIDRLRSM